MSANEGNITASLMDPAVQSCPYEFYREVQEKCPVYRMPETGFYLVTKYDDLRQITSDTETFTSAGPRASGDLQGEEAMAEYREILESGAWLRTQTLQRSDPPEHGRYRKLVNKVFTPRRVKAEVAPRIEVIVNDLIDDFILRGECEFMEDFAIALPAHVMTEQLGLDRSEVPTFKSWIEATLAPSMRKLSRKEIVEAANTEVEAQQHLAKVMEDRRQNPAEDLITALVQANTSEGEELTMNELQDILQQLISGGFETTSSALGHGMWLLLRNPDQMALLRSDPDVYMNSFVEEVLRIESPVQGLTRRATRDVEVNGTLIPAGSIVVARYGAANRDEEKFEEADVFDITRKNASSHVSFGHGPHFCVGAALARAEISLAFTAILARMDNIALAAPMPDPAHHPSLFQLPIKELKLSFTPVNDRRLKPYSGTL